MKRELNKIPIIIDTDPGIDDAFTLMLALGREELDVKAITTVHGNNTIEYTTENALRLISYFNREDIKVAKGAGLPFNQPLHIADFVHGKTGLGDLKLPKSDASLYEKNAWDTIYEVAKKEGEITIVALGPLTNIAMALRMYPDLKDYVNSISLMGGACFGGNVSPCAEANINSDPEAASIVFNSGIPIIMAGLDVTMKTMILDEEAERIRNINSELSNTLMKLFDFYSIFQKSVIGLQGVVVHDLSAVMYLIAPEIYKTKKCNVEIELKGQFTRGKTVVDYFNVTDKPKNTEVLFEVDKEAFVQKLIETIEKFPLK
ncbi:nucleoside hydrolase [Hathewaya massiliensis]|uniref:nucleoside hydrolase n=1 Tax=Hathewaya massiliensis TaxID=1964382 RepID=UPI001158FAFF|nr:nucleoside hydrolase [Hathewaya massiliensis]